ncbi:response regulator [Paenibacillus thermoaerophilus]|uniref:Response regulator n=1 Tax=Paenibacillus thermoaerophilus TaxID=1215385 RepID=A0ABW2V8L8_9BACL|nr:response regulator [Paenibacillus thermoaerophilus]TMV06663.1 response regulator [Paenibacillus thermoaerophilus]
MYRVLIVDDEPEIRTGLRMKVDWERLGLEVADEAANGAEAHRLLSETDIDIVITDMNMPMMDGISFLESCRERYPGLRTIVLTGYEDFRYARAAVRTQARDYLLKPVSRDELEAALLKVKQELDRERQLTDQRKSLEWRLSQYYKEMKGHFVVHIVKEEWRHMQDFRDRARLFELEAWDGREVRFVVAGLRERRTGEIRGERTPEKLRLPFELICKEFADQSPQAPLYFQDRSYPGLIFLIVPGAEEVCREFAGQLRSCVAQHLSEEPAVAVGQPAKGFSEWREGYMSALLSWNLTDANGPYPMKEEADGASALSAESRRLLRKHLLRGDMDAFQATVRKELTRAFERSQAFYVKAIFQLYLEIEAAAHESGTALDSKDELWMRPEMALGLHTVDKAERFFVRMGERIVRMQNKEDADFQRVKRYIDSHYMYDLNLTVLAERFSYHPSYFSEWFKSRMGLTFIQYLTGVRMAQAVRLLEDTSLPLWDIAELTGFASASYFSSKFKKQFGLSPSDYRQNAQKKRKN